MHAPRGSLAFTQPARLVSAQARGEHPLRLCIADGFWPRFRGLMLAPPLQRQPQVQALLLRHCTSVHGCFMRYPLDIVYLSDADETGAHGVTHTARLRRWGISMAPRARPPSKHVLEMPAGSIQALGIAPGDQLRLGA